jgi:glycosyltransferase involved in cell wall biosynthesis
MPNVSVVIPACNEAAWLPEVVARVRATGLVREIVIVDDGSVDDTPRIVRELAVGTPPLVAARHERNRGKGAAIRTGVALARGDIVLVQDADLEYDPADYGRLLAPFADPAVQAVYGSRNLQANPRSTQAFYWGGRGLSWWANALYGSRLTDIATGYKVVRAPLLRELKLACDGFEFCEEITAGLLRRGVSIHEVPISYRPRTRAQGKKIRARDGFTAVWTLCRLRLGRRE